jgi:hypothetical protein
MHKHLIFLMAQCGAALATDYWLPVAGTYCQVWSDETLQKDEVIRWSGGCKEGKGFRLWPNGELYEGAFVKDKQQGSRWAHRR